MMSIMHRCRYLEHCYLFAMVLEAVLYERAKEKLARLLAELRGKTKIVELLSPSPVKPVSNLLSLFAPLPIPYFKLFYRGAWSKTLEADLVIAHHEHKEVLEVAGRLAEEYGTKSVAVLQSPPFYGNKARREKIEQAVMLFYELSSRFSGIDGVLARAYYMLSLKKKLIASKFVERDLNRIDVLLSVSPSIPFEMGEPWSSRVISMKLWAGVDTTKVEKLRAWRREGKREKCLAVFAARLDPLKGLADLVLTWRLVKKQSRCRPRLILIGMGGRRRLRFLIRIAKALNIDDSIMYLGYLSGDEYWRVRSSASLTLYPSHVDSFSYTVFESLMLGVPVVAYDIPALRFNYEEQDGLHLVPEGDVEALAQRSVELLESPETVEREPLFKTWDEIALEELAVLRAVAKG